MKISILTLFPEMFQGPFDYSIIKKAQEKKKVKINFVNIRDFGIGKHKVVDDKPYGGGHGMILRVDVLEKAISKTKYKNPDAPGQKIILLNPRGKIFNQEKLWSCLSLNISYLYADTTKALMKGFMNL